MGTQLYQSTQLMKKLRVLKLPFQFEIKQSMPSFPKSTIAPKNILQKVIQNFSEEALTHFLFLLSPSKTICFQRMETVMKFLEKYPKARIQIHLVWTKISEKDHIFIAEQMRHKFSENRICHYWDPSHQWEEQLKSLLEIEGSKPIWDIYLGYGKNKNPLEDRPDQSFGELENKFQTEEKQETQEKQLDHFLEKTSILFF